MTNYEHIKNMSVNEFLKYFSVCRFIKPFVNCNGRSCIKCQLEWLNEEVDE